MWWRAIFALLLTGLACLLAACGSSAGGTAPATGYRAGNLAPDFTLPDASGRPVSLHDFQGRPVVLNFWATDCAPCVAELPLLNRLYEEESAQPDGAVLVSVNTHQTAPAVQGFLEENGYRFPVLVDAPSGNTVTVAYGVQYLPMTYFISSEGIIRGIKIGEFTTMDEVRIYLGKIGLASR